MAKPQRRQDFWLWILSVLVAMVIWVYVTQRPQSQAEVGWHMAVQPAVRNVSDGLAVEVLPRVIDVAVQAPAEAERRSRADVRAYVDLKGLGPGRHQVKVVVPALRTGRIVGVEPRTVAVRISPLESRAFPVEAVVAGEPLDGYTAMAATVSPGEVWVRGPADALREMRRIPVKVDVTGVERDVEVDARVEVRDESGESLPVTVVPGQVQVRVPVVPSSAVERLPVRAVVQGTPGAGFVAAPAAVEPSEVQVVLEPGGAVPTALTTLPVSIDGATGAVAVTRGIVIPGQVKSIKPAAVLVTVPVERKP